MAKIRKYKAWRYTGAITCVEIKEFEAITINNSATL